MRLWVGGWAKLKSYGVYVCVCACVCACVCSCVFVYTCVCIYLHIYTHLYVGRYISYLYMYVCVYMYILAHIRITVAVAALSGGLLVCTSPTLVIVCMPMSACFCVCHVCLSVFLTFFLSL